MAVLIAIGVGWGALWSFSNGIKFPFSDSEHTQPATTLTAVVTAPPKKDTTILMGGDIMFDRNVRVLANKNGYDSLLAGVAPLFKTADIAVANLEGPITDFPSKTLLPDGTFGQELVFTSDPAAAAEVAHAHISLVSLANNHTDNFGISGLNQTKKYLDSAGVDYFGDPWNRDGYEKIIEKNGMRIAFVGYHAFQKGFDRVIASVKRLTAEGDFVVVMPHWGVEYSLHPTDLQKEQARALVAAGAKAVIGSHPHVIEDHEWIASPQDGAAPVPVFYSLGNLLFDQYFSTNVMKGNIVKLVLVNGKNGPSLDSVQIYETSLATKKDVTVNMEPIGF